MKKYLFFALVVLTVSCSHRPMAVKEITTEDIVVDSTLNAIQDSDYLQVLEKYRAQLDAEMDVKIGEAPEALRVGAPESGMSNWAADVLREVAKGVTKQDVDIAVVNIGGLRCDWEAGDITIGNVFELMPFDNELVVFTLTGEDILALCDCWAKVGGQGESGIRMGIKEGKAVDVRINGAEVVPQMLYRVATNDYLADGKDFMEPLANHTDMIKTNLLLRDVYIDYIKKHPLVKMELDGRIVVL